MPTSPDLLEPGWRASRRELGRIGLHVVEAGPSEGPLLVLLHGFPELWWAWRKQIGPLAAQGYHVVVPDLRGYADSDAPDGIAAYHLDELVADVVALADDFGARRFRLVAHDWGGVIAWGLAAAHPERLSHLVVMDAPHPDVWAGDALRHPTQALRSSYVAFFQLPWVPEAALSAMDYAGLRAMMQKSALPGTFADEALRRYVEAWTRPGRLTAMLNYYRALRERPAPAVPRRIAMPTLILWGEHDSALAHHVARSALALCERGRLVIVDGTTHWLHLEAPQRIVDELTTFLAD